ncbi:hypothetical protein [Helicobacter valdiviensis]|uniref:hypothetical protein n=1 Tax=Helicobacter valdiviensis TaxID=1458358 RepID=UPI0015EC3B47|nr:hypothetical protein [Helicobacter valdiviensis]
MTNLPQGWKITNFNNINSLLEFSSLGKAHEIAEDFGGIPMLRSSIEELQRYMRGK